MFIAKLIGLDGFVDEKRFSTKESAMAWLRGDGLENFDGNVEASELWSSEGLLWHKSRPKTEDPRNTGSFRSSRLKQEEDQKKFREWLYGPRKRRRRS